MSDQTLKDFKDQEIQNVDSLVGLSLKLDEEIDGTIGEDRIKIYDKYAEQMISILPVIGFIGPIGESYMNALRDTYFPDLNRRWVMNDNVLVKVENASNLINNIITQIATESYGMEDKSGVYDKYSPQIASILANIGFIGMAADAYMDGIKQAFVKE